MYRIINIGASFSNRDRAAFEASLNQYEREGWELDTVFSVSQRSCLGQSADTNFMILRKPGDVSTPSPGGMNRLAQGEPSFTPVGGTSPDNHAEWGNRVRAYWVGGRYRGRVVSVSEDVAEIELAPGIAGRLRRDRIPGNPTDARTVISPGDEVTILVVMVSYDTREIDLRMVEA